MTEHSAAKNFSLAPPAPGAGDDGPRGGARREAVGRPSYVHQTDPFVEEGELHVWIYFNARDDDDDTEAFALPAPPGFDARGLNRELMKAASC